MQRNGHYTFPYKAAVSDYIFFSTFNQQIHLYMKILVIEDEQSVAYLFKIF